MALPESFLEDFTGGYAQLIANAGLGFVYADTYTPTDWAIGLMAFPQAIGNVDIDTAVAFAPYPLTDNPTMNMTEVGLQVKCRAAGRDPRIVWRMDDAISNVLLGNYPITLPTGVRVATLQRTSSGSLGQDDSERWLWTSNYPCNVFRPTLHRV